MFVVGLTLNPGGINGAINLQFKNLCIMRFLPKTFFCVWRNYQI